MVKHALALAAAALLQAGTAVAAPAYQVTQLSPDGTTRWTHLNNAGAATGYLGGQGYVRAADGQLTAIPQLSGQPTAITAFGDNGAVGLMRMEEGPPQNVQETGLWRSGLVEALPTLRTTPDGLGYGVVNRISGNGLLAGTSAVNGGFYDEYGNLIPYTHAATFRNGQVQDLGTLGGSVSMGYGINDSGTVVGFSLDASDARRAFIHRDGAMQDLGLADDYVAFDINNAGQVLANSGTSAASAVIWRDGATTTLSLSGYTFSDASAINNRGDVVGRLFAPAQSSAAFLYSDGEMVLLADLLTQPGWTIREVTDINDSGTILGVGCQGIDCSWVLLTPVPEPATWGMLGAGLALLGLVARRRHRPG
ncbi:PEP-CTERM sorting domain-containing protein [Pseudoduganella chitinolytica]|uniref:PEP-CTERM sorting domain-containing protein n=1 Tax=Pseudoduganella chitinolytica TaxID=34070 RepID=A0ABY8B5J0_9BURK|nr:PEP-CTERM sorting domain-containing protein [Pseudoduganella chitinolytica]WEF31145.1 PEP-CTERM sorting domain-containing protein [Pseudoduganella chitinolytica]